MSVALAIAASATCEVLLDGMWWRIKRIRSRDMARVGMAHFVGFGADEVAAVMDGGKPVDKARKLSELLASAAANPTQYLAMSDSQAAVIAAGVVAAAAPEVVPLEWSEIRFTVTDSEHNPEASVLAVSGLASGTRRELCEAIMSHSSEQGRVSKALAGFRGEASNAP